MLADKLPAGISPPSYVHFHAQRYGYQFASKPVPGGPQMTISLLYRAVRETRLHFMRTAPISAFSVHDVCWVDALVMRHDYSVILLTAAG